MTPYYDEGGITIYHGDCLEVMADMDVAADLVVTDPPYSVSVAGSRYISRKSSRSLDFFDGDRDWAANTQQCCDALDASMRCVSDVASCYWYCGHRVLSLLASRMESHGLSTRFLVWSKMYPRPSPPGAGWCSGAELCLYGYPKGRTWTHRGIGPSSVFVADSYRSKGRPGKVSHPTQKPPAVIVPLLEASSVEGHLVLDPFMGSGTTLVVARDMGRRAIGIEVNEVYCEIAAKRLSQGVLAYG